MATFDKHSKCARFWDKGLGSDPCVLKPVLYILTNDQKSQLATPTYKARKEMKDCRECGH